MQNLIATAADWSARAYIRTTFGHGAGHGLVDTDGDMVVVAFRGTTDACEWMADLEFQPQRYDRFRHNRYFHDDRYVHRGFEAALDDVWPTVWYQVLHRLHPRPCKILVTGHSLGGALAVLAAERFLERDANLAITCVTFGQPRVGNASYAAHHRAPPIRVINALDIVPWVPGRLMPLLCLQPTLYTHCGKAMLLGTDGQVIGEPGVADLVGDWARSWLPGSVARCREHHQIEEYQRRLRLAGFYGPAAAPAAGDGEAGDEGGERKAA